MSKRRDATRWGAKRPVEARAHFARTQSGANVVVVRAIP